MMKNLKLFGILLSILYITVACNKKIDEPFFNVETQTVNFEATGGTIEVPVKTNVGFDAKANDEWLDVKTEASKIILTATANTERQDRETEVTVFANNKTSKFKVHQLGQNLQIEVTPQELTAEPNGGILKFTITTNAKTYEAVCEDKWVSLTKNDGGVYAVSVEKNPSPEVRKTSINILINGNSVKSITLSQAGQPKSSFLLPLFIFGNPTADIKSQEEERGIKLVKEEDIAQGTILKYEIQNDTFSGWNYLINLERYVSCAMYAKDGTFTEKQRTDFENFLLEQGFEKIIGKGFENSLSMEEIDKELFVNKQLQAKFELMKDKVQNYLLSYFPWQQTPQKTFTQPFTTANFGFTKEQITTFEEGLGSRLNSNESSFNYGKVGAKKDRILFEVKKPSPDNLLYRQYYVYYPNQKKTGVTQMDLFFEDATLAMFQGLDARYYLTNEFLEYMSNNGYTFNGYSKKYDQYVFKKEGKTFTVKYLKVSESLGWLLRISTF